MKFAKTNLMIAGMILLFISCKTVQPFAEADRLLITSGTAETPFRILQVTEKPDSVLLRKPCANFKNFAGDSTFQLLVARLKKTLEVENGVGIAASQVGLSKNIFLFMRLDLPDKPIHVAVNPKIVHHPDTTVCFERDGCLSIPDRSGNSVRYTWIDVEYQNEKGDKIRERLEGYSRQNTFTAVIFQHEYDHTRGILFTDKLCK
ncbi:peptide deformylase [Bacteroidia bacterium]|nr:peptide deformylase [Bacteroidia bacterium]